jgi:hypothetical protein
MTESVQDLLQTYRDGAKQLEYLFEISGKQQFDEKAKMILAITDHISKAIAAEKGSKSTPLPKNDDGKENAVRSNFERLYRVKVIEGDSLDLYYRRQYDGTLTIVKGDASDPRTHFTLREIENHHLQNCEREELADLFVLTGADIIKEAATDWEQFTDNGEMTFRAWFPDQDWLEPKRKYETNAMLNHFEEV